MSTLLPDINSDDFSSNLVDNSANTTSSSNTSASTTNITGNVASTNTFYPNLLRPYASYTYNLTLQATTIDNFNAMLQNQKYDPNTWTTILKSGGVGATRAHRPTGPSEAGSSTQYFTKDLYIDNFVMQTILGQSQVTRGSNACEISFDIIEPFGLSFLDNLYDFCHDSTGLNESNYLQIPYLLVINFMGYKDDGVAETVQNATKYIPIIISDIGVQLNSGGSKYTVTALPFNELGFTEKYGTLNQSLEINGQKLIDVANSLTSKINAEQQEYVAKKIYEYPDTYNIIFANQSSTEPNTGSIDIGNVIVASPADIAIKDTPMQSPPSSDGQTINVLNVARNLIAYQQISAIQTTGVNIDVANSSVKFNSGSSILDCLNNLVINSKYITDQVIEYKKKLTEAQNQISSQTTTATQQSTASEKIASLQYPLQWYKIVSQIILGKYDNSRKTYQKTITYTVKPYLIDNSKSTSAPGTTPSLRVVKNYDYLFTGKNQEIIDFDLTFNTAYHTYAQSNIDTKDLGTGGNTPDQNTGNTSSSTTKIVTATVSNPQTDALTITAVPNSDKNPVGIGTNNPDRGTASDIASTIYSRAELLTISMEIFGDPDYIKQDEIFLTPSATLVPYVTGNAGAPGGVMFDCGEIYFNLTFQTPQDYDLTTGLAQANLQNTTSKRRNLYTGLYHVNTVSSKMDQGKFTQTVEAIKYNDSNKLEAVTSSTTLTATASPTITSDAG